ncbi:hypothetical protein [Companilactobacillus nuruki]|uniref:Uncharacterized protein n=1 Tax=Companilactobacillus nuruki TaxID=1993540 RepID=A0A2N7AT80_9LACO|nr:hypothetical protein [Companilactobacillus nuruki]PMD69062.1 hypothetical protein CBP76_08555 [Companilactobacillus nuruki]
MKFFTGFVVGTISGIAINILQSDTTPNLNDTKLFRNIKDFKDILADLQKNASVVPEVLSGIQNDIADYSQSIKPDVEELQSSIADMQSTIDEFNNK